MIFVDSGNVKNVVCNAKANAQNYGAYVDCVANY